ncbi:MAG: hypothetical protein ACWA45_03140 [Flavobacteriales bacterium]
MRKILPKSLSFSHLLCSTFNHDYIVTKRISGYINEYRCANCGREVTNNLNGELELLTPKKRKTNRDLLIMHSKKHHH